MDKKTKIKLKRYKKLKQLIEQWTRADVMSRLGRFDNLEFADYALIKLEKEDEIRKLLYKTSSLVELGFKWKILKRPKEIKKGFRLGKSKKN